MQHRALSLDALPFLGYTSLVGLYLRTLLHEFGLFCLDSLEVLVHLSRSCLYLALSPLKPAALSLYLLLNLPLIHVLERLCLSLKLGESLLILLTSLKQCSLLFYQGLLCLLQFA